MKGEAKVHLVGAGPGDPDLLTVKALRLLQAADVLVYDRLVSREILRLVPEGATRVCVGKAPGKHTLPQEEINRILVELAAPGRCVVRLKGGDPYVFGRGSEEALYLLAHGIGFEVVPGVTAATAVAAYAGIPLTHRGLARGVRFVTGHFRDDEALDWDWDKLAETQTTLVFYMGLGRLDAICGHLVEAGMPAATPAAVIQHGTTVRQRRVLSDLAHLPEDVRQAGLASPALIVIGTVVALAETLDWFTAQPADATSGDRLSRYASA